jgi:CHAT domain
MDEWELRELAAAIRLQLPALIGAEAARELDARLAAALDRTPGRSKKELRRLLLVFAPEPVRAWVDAQRPAEPDGYRGSFDSTRGVPAPAKFRGPGRKASGDWEHLRQATDDDRITQDSPRSRILVRPPFPETPPDRWAEVDAQVLSFAIPELGPDPRTPLAVGRDYTAVFKAGPGWRGNLLSELESAALGPLPPGGLDTRWIVTSRTARLSPADPADPEVEVVTAEAGRNRQWMATFPLHIPGSGDSAERRLALTPLDRPEARIDVQVMVGDDVYRQLTASLTVQRGDGAGRVIEVITEQTLPAAHAGLAPAHEWQAPARQLNIVVTGPDAAAVTCEAIPLYNPVGWGPVQGEVESAIAGVRGALDRLRDRFPGYWDGIAAEGLLPALSRYVPGPHDWLPPVQPPPPRADWLEVAASDELYQLAYYGNSLYQETFGADVRRIITDNLAPGDLLRLSWQEGSSSWVPELPLALMYLEPPRRGQVDPERFLGLRYRLGYNRVRPASSSRALGDWARTTRAHLIYWGAGPGDPLAAEAGRHRAELATWAAGLRLLPDDAAVAGRTATAQALASYLEDPEPAPVSLLYLYCHCRDGRGTSPVLRFGPDNSPASELGLPDIGGEAFPDAPVVFVNACDSGAAEPLLANQLMRQFFRRGCRAYIGTEVKVPAALAARFATVFFSFLYGDAGRGIAPVGEAMARARRFLWTEYQNIGGLFYGYVNDYSLYAADAETVAGLPRRPI